MAERIRLRSGRLSESTESLLETLKEYTHRVTTLTGLLETQRTRILLVSYMLLSIAFVVILFATFLIEKAGFDDKLTYPLLVIFIFVTAIIVPGLVWGALIRARQYGYDLSKAIERLETTMSYVSQIKDHMSLEKMDEILMQMHLHEADDALAHARRVLRRYSPRFWTIG